MRVRSKTGKYAAPIGFPSGTPDIVGPTVLRALTPFSELAHRASPEAAGKVSLSWDTITRLESSGESRAGGTCAACRNPDVNAPSSEEEEL